MKKVAILNPYLPTLGGGEKYMGYMCKEIENYYNNDVRIDVITFNYNDIHVTDENYVTINDVNKQYGLDLGCTYVRKIDQDALPAGTNLERYVYDLSAEYDLFINFMIFSKWRGKAKKNVYLCMFPPKTFSQDLGEAKFFAKIKAKLKDIRFKCSYQKFVIISQYSNHWFKEWWGNARTTIVYSPVFSEKNLDGRYNESDKENIILSVGRFFVDAHSKKQLELAEIFDKNSDKFGDYEYHIVGQVSNLKKDLEYVDKIKAIADSNGKIFVHVNEKYENLIELYKKCKIFWHATGYGVDDNLYPEKMEHFGITTVEAMSYGAVPVVINKGGQPEIVKDGINGFVWNDGEECAEKTHKVICDDAMRVEMAEKSKDRSAFFSQESFYKHVEGVLNELQI